MATGPWFWCNHIAMEKAREAGGWKAAVVYYALCIRESKTPPQFKSAFKASLENIKHDSGVSLATIKRMLPLLVQVKLITIQSGKSRGTGRGDARSHEANTYCLLDVSLAPTELTLAPAGRKSGATKKNLSPQGEKEIRPSASAGGLTAPSGGGQAAKSTYIFE